MVAYSFKKQFVLPIKAGLGQVMEPWLTPKRQTIRSVGKKRHARPGEVIQLYCGLRTKNCFSIGVARCVSAEFITLNFALNSVTIGGRALISKLDHFAQGDGFKDWDEMREFWRATHAIKRLGPWTGIIIKWEPIT